MVNEQINQEIELHTAPGKKNKKKILKSHKGERIFLFFLLDFLKKKEGIIFVFW